MEQTSNGLAQIDVPANVVAKIKEEENAQLPMHKRPDFWANVLATNFERLELWVKNKYPSIPANKIPFNLADYKCVAPSVGGLNSSGELIKFIGSLSELVIPPVPAFNEPGEKVVLCFRIPPGTLEARVTILHESQLNPHQARQVKRVEKTKRVEIGKLTYHVNELSLHSFPKAEIVSFVYSPCSVCMWKPGIFHDLLPPEERDNWVVIRPLEPQQRTNQRPWHNNRRK